VGKSSTDHDIAGELAESVGEPAIGGVGERLELGEAWRRVLCPVDRVFAGGHSAIATTPESVADVPLNLNGR
jgi:hypothetical protein